MPQTLYIVTYPAGTGTPSDIQIVAGQQFSGAAASWSGNATWTGSGQYLEATGLSASTEYDSAAVIYDGTTYSNVVQVVGTWTTLSGATAAELATTPTAQSTATGTLTTAIPLAAAGLTTGSSGLAGEATAQASAAGALLTQIPLAGTASAYASGAGNLSTLIMLDAAAASVSSATGALTVESTISGAALAQALAAGSLTTHIRLDAAALARAAASGSLSGSISPLNAASIRHTVHARADRYAIDATPTRWEIAA